ncbi:MAG: hypothetical protein AAB551_00470 [Patescibacteria group bacterium]
MNLSKKSRLNVYEAYLDRLDAVPLMIEQARLGRGQGRISDDSPFSSACDELIAVRAKLCHTFSSSAEISRDMPVFEKLLSAFLEEFAVENSKSHFRLLNQKISDSLAVFEQRTGEKF